MTLLFCNIGWMNRYDGSTGDQIARGGSYNNHSIGHEVCNFSKVNGKVYGYVQPTGQIAIERLGAKVKDQSVTGITVIWTAGPETGGTVVVGWYKNATVFRNSQRIETPSEIHKLNNLDSYRIIADATNATLLPTDQRSLVIPRGVRGGIGQSNVWYADSPASSEIVERVRLLVQSNGESESLPDVDNAVFGIEGNPRLVAHMRRERNSSIVQRKKNEVSKIKGSLKCEVCQFDFAEKYGEYGKDFCEVHHLTPLSQSDGKTKTELSDLAVVCSNCHRILHKINPMPTISALAKIVAESNGA